MKDLIREMTTREAESVIARLMGLHMLPLHNQQPIRKQHRVLSDRYIHKSASVGVRYGSLVSIRLSNRKFDEIPSGVKAVSGVTASEYKHEFTSKNDSSSISSKIQLHITHQKPDSSSIASRACSGKRKAFCKKENPYTCKYDLRYLQKHKMEMSDDLCSGISIHALKFGSHSKSDGREFRQSSRHRHGKVHYELAHRKLVSNNIITPRRSCVVHNRTTNENSQQVTHRSSSDDVSGFVGEKYLKSKPDAFLWKKQDEYNWIYKLKNEEFFKKDILESQGGRNHEGFQFSLGVNGSMSQSSESSSSCFSGSDSEKYGQSIQDEISERRIGTELSSTHPESSISNPDFQHSTEDAAVVNTEACKVDDSRTSLDKDEQAKLYPLNLSSEDAHASFCFQAASMGESLLKELSSEESNFPKIGNSEFQNYLKITNQQSPDSVLESLDIQNPSTFERFRSLGLLLQLQNLDFESEDETHSEEFKMFVSDDEDSTQQHGKFSQHEKKIESWFRDEKSRYFSYMVDVLDEAGFCSETSFMDYSTESLISPLVFKSLEKKYGKQTSWIKSEKHLLFDRINSALLEIVGPILEFRACEKYVRRWFGEAWMRDEIEDRLWMLLVNEESGNFTEEALALGGMGKWMELGEDIGVICGEIESYLFDELVMEFVSLRD